MERLSKTAPAEEAHNYLSGIRTEKDKRRIARWGFAYIVVAALVPLLIAFVLPLFRRP
ncbi:hypothetical protein [Cupriavidus metallidurans]